METAICLTIGFCLGAGAAVALLFCVRAAAEAAGLRSKPARPEKHTPEEPDADEPLSFERQLQNLFAYDGKIQKAEDVSEDD